MTWRGWVAWAGLGCSAVLGWRADWLASAGAAFGAAMLAAWWVRGQLLATRRTLRVLAEMSAVADSLDSRTARDPRLSVIRPRVRDLPWRWEPRLRFRNVFPLRTMEPLSACRSADQWGYRLALAAGEAQTT